LVTMNSEAIIPIPKMILEQTPLRCCEIEDSIEQPG